MFNIWKRSAPAADFSFLQTDMHSHLIPGVDDGAKDEEDSLQLIRGLQELGFEKLITTPHIYREYYPNTAADLKKRTEDLNQYLSRQGLSLNLSCGAEYFLDEHFEGLLEEGEFLTIGKNHVLVEMGFYGPYPRLEDLLFQLKLSGYQPIIAHPERYLYYTKAEAFQRLKDLGCLLQCNLLSFAGHYGQAVQKWANRLLRAEMVDLLGTDCHNKTQLESLKMLLQHKVMKQLSQYPFKNPTLFG